MNLEDRIFTKARLGRFWTPDLAQKCLAFFGRAPYKFDQNREQEFQARFPHDYNDHLKSRMTRELATV